MKSRLLFHEGIQSPVKLPCYNMSYSNWDPSQMTEEAPHTTPVQIRSVTINLLWSHTHIIPLLSNQLEPFVPSMVISSQSHVSSAAWVLNSIITPVPWAQTSVVLWYFGSTGPGKLFCMVLWYVGNWSELNHQSSHQTVKYHRNAAEITQIPQQHCWFLDSGKIQMGSLEQFRYLELYQVQKKSTPEQEGYSCDG